MFSHSFARKKDDKVCKTFTLLLMIVQVALVLALNIGLWLNETTEG
jgi:hypothetical protein